MTMNGGASPVPPPVPYTCAMCGWFRAASVFASRSKRPARSGRRRTPPAGS
jgi:hypothetical protein